MTAPTLAIPAPAAQPHFRVAQPTTVQVWAVWAQDFDERVRVEVEDAGDWNDRMAAACELGAEKLRASTGKLRISACNVLARYVVTRTRR